MSWRCFIVDGHDNPDSMRPGAMWLASAFGKFGWMMRLPNGAPWHVNGPSSNGSPWTVTGTAPNLTAQPSINCEYPPNQTYHGFLTNGVLSDDLEGRSY